jgi:mRNA-degrading endonuclease toxin of MazEF toxin-antitoxin module
MPAPRPQRGDIYWLEMKQDQTKGSEQYGYRPWLVVSVNSINTQLPIVVAVPLTAELHKIENARQFRILIPDSQKIQEPGHPKGCKGDSLALTEQVRVLSIERLPSQRAARLPERAMGAVEAGIAFVIDIG